MFDLTDKPRVFALPCGVDFPRALANGLLHRTQGQPAHMLARVELIINTTRMRRRIGELFDQGPAALLPRLSLLTDFGNRSVQTVLPPALPP